MIRDNADWTSVAHDADDERTHEALGKLSEASDLYDRYVQLAGINSYPTAAELAENSVGSNGLAAGIFHDELVCCCNA